MRGKTRLSRIEVFGYLCCGISIAWMIGVILFLQSHPGETIPSDLVFANTFLPLFIYMGGFAIEMFGRRRRHEREKTAEKHAKESALQRLFPDWTTYSIGELSGLIRANQDGVEVAIGMPPGTIKLNLNLASDGERTVEFGNNEGGQFRLPLSIRIDELGTVLIKEFTWYDLLHEANFVVRTRRSELPTPVSTDSTELPPGGG